MRVSIFGNKLYYDISRVVTHCVYLTNSFDNIIFFQLDIPGVSRVVIRYAAIKQLPCTIIRVPDFTKGPKGYYRAIDVLIKQIDIMFYMGNTNLSIYRSLERMCASKGVKYAISV